MFGISLSKILLTALVIAAVWYGWRAYARFQTLRENARRRMEEESRRAGAGGQSRPGTVEAEETVECPVCGAFVAASRGLSCGRKDCPYPG